MNSPAEVSLQKASILYHLPNKNAHATRIIRDYAAKHSAMDIGVGLVSLAPGAAIPAIIAAIALQSKVIYKPMAEELAGVYLSETDSYTDHLGNIASVATVGMEFAQEFALEFLTEHAQELILEMGLGALATFIPFAGAVVGAALDFLIAQMMTWRVGTMTSIYFQNGAEWIGSRKTTMGIAKELTGGLHVSLSDVVSGLQKTKAQASQVRVDFDRIPEKVPQVKRSAVSNIMPILKALASNMPRPAVRNSLLGMGLPPVLVDSAITEFYPALA